MTIDFWGLGLQAINVLVLVWLLTRVFWRPVAGAIARRQQAAQALLDAGEAAQAKADAALAEVTGARAGIVAEREAVLTQARAAAEAATKVTLAEARTQAETLRTAARTAIDRDRDAARKATAAQAAALSAEIAARLLERFNTPAVQVAFLTQLIEAIAGLSEADRATLVAADPDLEVVTAAEPGGAQKARIAQAVNGALGGEPTLRFVTEPGLIAGLELRCAHFVLHNSWSADLERLMKEVGDAS
jgi:F-type H+-transporting ATPase subunit b